MVHNPPLYNWLTTRSSGVLLHMSSLPSKTGIGNLGAGAYAHIDFMQAAGLQIWQMCPLGPTGFGDSPYQSFSSFAGNPYFIDLDPLLNAGLLAADEIAILQGLPVNAVDYGQLYVDFYPVLTKAYQRFIESEKMRYSIMVPFQNSLPRNQTGWIPLRVLLPLKQNLRVAVGKNGRPSIAILIRL